MRASEPKTTMQMKPRNHGPIELCVKEWIELTIPERVRNVPKSESAERHHHEQVVPDAQHPALLLDHHRVQERRRREPRHQRGVLDRVPGVVAAPAHLLVGPVRAEQLADAERRPRDERPPARRDDPALVVATCEQRSRREGERDGEADEAEIEQRRVGHHVRVLEARVEPVAVRRRRLRRERRRDDDEQECEEDGDAAEHGHHPGDEIAGGAPVHEQGGGRVAGQDQQPEQERSLLPAPEGRDRVAGGQLAARVLGDVDEREVVPDQRGDEDERGDDARPEGRDERVLRREREPAATLPGSVGAGDDGVDRETQRGDERGAAELRHATLSFLAVYFDGHFVTSESLTRDEDAVAQLTLDRDLATGAELIGDRARVDDRHRLVEPPLMSRSRKRRPPP